MRTGGVEAPACFPEMDITDGRAHLIMEWPSELYGLSARGARREHVLTYSVPDTYAPLV